MVCGGFAGVLRVFCKLTGKIEGGRIIMATGSERKDSFADAFYRGHQWRRCAGAYRKKVIWCERCAKQGLTVPGVEVHHIRKLTPETVNDPDVALNWGNLELLCAACHKAEHGKRRWRADESGHVEAPPV